MSCGMCVSICWQCQERLQKLKNELEALEESGAHLELAFAEASNTERGALAERLATNTEMCWSLREEIEDLEGTQ